MGNTISIIIPAYNEHKRIGITLAHLYQLFEKETTEIIVVDQSDDHRTKQQIKQYPHVIYLRSEGHNRGSNLHQGALAAHGNLLLFLHADTHLPRSAPDILHHLNLNTYRYGAFARTFDTELSLISKIVNKLHLFVAKHRSYLYGDQAIFTSREAYRAVDGYKPRPLFEDVDFSRRLGRYARMTGTQMKRIDDPVVTSSRRFETKATWQTVAFMSRMSILYHIGVDPDRIAEIYYT